MITKTYTLLVTVRDDGCAAVFNTVILAAAVKGALESGCEFMLNSTEVYRLADDPMLNPRIGLNRLTPVVVAEVDAFQGDLLEDTMRLDSKEVQAAKRLHWNFKNCP